MLENPPPWPCRDSACLHRLPELTPIGLQYQAGFQRRKPEPKKRPSGHPGLGGRQHGGTEHSGMKQRSATFHGETVGLPVQEAASEVSDLYTFRRQGHSFCLRFVLGTTVKNPQTSVSGRYLSRIDLA